MIIDLDLTSVLKLELHILSDSISFFPPKNLCATFIQFEMNSQSTFYTHTHTHTHTHTYIYISIHFKYIKQRICEKAGLPWARWGRDQHNCSDHSAWAPLIWGGDYLENYLSCPLHFQCLLNEPLL